MKNKQLDDLLAIIGDDDMTVPPSVDVQRAMRVELANQLKAAILLADAETLRANRAEAALRRCRSRAKTTKKRTP